jgi:hypothetical protein
VRRQLEEVISLACAADNSPTLYELVEITFTVHHQIRRITTHDPHTLSLPKYMPKSSGAPE